MGTTEIINGQKVTRREGVKQPEVVFLKPMRPIESVQPRFVTVLGDERIKIEFPWNSEIDRIRAARKSLAAQ